jgi:drug/metabolite transporter (DMT)-like permease
MNNKLMLAYFYCFCSVGFFATLEVGGKLLSPLVNPYVVTIYRFMIGAIVMAPLAFIHRPKDLVTSDYLRMALPGILNVSISMVLLQMAILYGKASLVALLISCNPLFVAIFTPLILRERLDWAQILGLIVGLAGLLLIISEAGGFARHGVNTLAVVLGLSAAATFGLYSVISRPLVKRYGNLYFNFVSFLAGSLVLAAYCWVRGISLPIPVQTSDWLLLIYLGVIVTGMSYYLFFLGQSQVPTLAASLMFFLKPVIAAVLTSLLLNDRVTPVQMVSIVVVALGVNIKPILSLRGKR